MRSCALPILLLYAASAAAQVNGYARISSCSGNILTVAQSNESGATFDEGDYIVLMQMQDNVIGSTANDATFGSLGSIQQAGRYEILRVSTLTRTAGALSTLVLDTPPSYTYNTGGNARVQAITFERLGGGGDFTTTANITALNWNGNLGGVVAVQVDGRLRLAHAITADGAGFRGGARDVSNSGSCDVSTFRSANNDRYAEKGEGIHRNTNSDWVEARGRMLTGGGGGNEHNGGGGGGGNYTAGGDAGPGWSCGAGSAGGLGGLALGGFISAERVFIGGGGGGGEGNNNVSTDGGRGGGIVLMKADSIITQGTCGGVRISADGASAGQAGNDGAGGGGAGGSIIIQTNGFRTSSTCALTIRANGGAGGRVNDGATHGGGGGGGQGVVLFSSALPVGNVTISTLNGAGGCNSSAVPCTNAAQTGTGSNGSGVIANAGGPLPVELVSFQAFPVRGSVDLAWMTASEQNSSHFVVERSPDGQYWTPVDHVPAVGFSYAPMNYYAKDPSPLPGTSYYRLMQVDLDGSRTWSEQVPVHFRNDDEGLVAWPNPAQTMVTVRHDPTWERPSLRLHDSMGRNMPVAVLHGSGQLSFPVSALPNGTYTVEIATEHQRERTQVVVQH